MPPSLTVVKAVLRKSPNQPGAGGLGGALLSAAASAGAAVAGIGGLLPVVWELGQEFQFKFNPSDMKESFSAQFRTKQGTGTGSEPQKQYVGPGETSLSFTALLDEWDAPPGMGKDVGDMVLKLHELMQPESGKTNPPNMLFIWGSYTFEGYVNSVNATYSLFRMDGSAARAEVAMTMTGYNKKGSKPQNPTSGGPAGRLTRQLIEGDSLQSIAFREYGNPNYWRAIAEINDIDDPLSIAPGAHVLLPSKSDAKEMR